jgi:hypothetical protein
MAGIVDATFRQGLVMKQIVPLVFALIPLVAVVGACVTVP